MKGSIVKADARMRVRMMELWKETFHDSDAYVNMFFTNCYSPDYSLAYVEDDKVKAMLFGVPFTFNGFTAVADDYSHFTNIREDEARILYSGLQGLYLCGLATEESARRQGIMSAMIEKINETAKSSGFDFTFLIPANDGLVDYYSNRRYVKAIYRTVNRFASDHDFLKSVDDKGRVRCDSTDGYDSKLLYKVFDLMISQERRMPWLTLSHTVQEIDMIFEDCRQSGGRMFYALDSDDRLMAVTFAHPDDDGNVIMPHIYYRDEDSMLRVLDNVKRSYPDREAVIYSFPEMSHRAALWFPFHEARDVAASSDGQEDDSVDERAEVGSKVWYAADHSQVYGMLRLLRDDNVIFILRTLSDVAFSAKSLVVKSEAKEEIKLQKKVVEKLQPFAISDIRKKAEGMSLQRLGEILFRRPSHEDFIGMAYGLPRLPMNMAYMLD